jgi:single-stranded DNA-binding protein
MLAKWFNPAGVPDLSGKGATSESILLSMFEPKDKNGQAPAAAPRQAAPAQRPAAAPRQAPPPQAGGFDDMDDSIPF